MAQTDNSFLSDKIAIRCNHLPQRDKLYVLDCYAGNEYIWKGVKRLTGRNITTLPIDIRMDIGFHLPGDNRSYLQSIDLDKYDVIDLDAYGVPYDQLEIVFARDYKGAVFITFVQSIHGSLPYGLLEQIGYSRDMISKISTLFYRNGWDHFKQYLAKKGVSRIAHRTHAQKHYIYIRLE
jgi:hypothetical protein